MKKMNKNARTALEILSGFNGKIVVFNDFKEEDLYSEYIQPKMMADIVDFDVE